MRIGKSDFLKTQLQGLREPMPPIIGKADCVVINTADMCALQLGSEHAKIQRFFS